jgi:hypothetical protein
VSGKGLSVSMKASVCIVSWTPILITCIFMYFYPYLVVYCLARPVLLLCPYCTYFL